jgi:hypothetical protein
MLAQTCNLQILREVVANSSRALYRHQCRRRPCAFYPVTEVALRVSPRLTTCFLAYGRAGSVREEGAGYLPSHEFILIEPFEQLPGFRQFCQGFMNCSLHRQDNGPLFLFSGQAPPALLDVQITLAILFCGAVLAQHVVLYCGLSRNGR